MFVQPLETDLELLIRVGNQFRAAMELYYNAGLYPFVITTAQVVT